MISIMHSYLEAYVPFVMLWTYPMNICSENINPFLAKNNLMLSAGCPKVAYNANTMNPD